MKKKFQRFIDKIHVIYRVCTTKYFIFAGYSKREIENTGACFVENLPENDNEKRDFIECTCSFLVSEFIDN